MSSPMEITAIWRQTPSSKKWCARNRSLKRDGPIWLQVKIKKFRKMRRIWWKASDFNCHKQVSGPKSYDQSQMWCGRTFPLKSSAIIIYSLTPTWMHKTSSKCLFPRSFPTTTHRYNDKNCREARRQSRLGQVKTSQKHSHRQTFKGGETRGVLN